MLSRFFLTSLFCFAVVVSAHAAEPKMHTASLGVGSEYYSFENDDFEETGFLYGAHGSYTYRGKFGANGLPHGMLRADGRLIWGQIKNEGELLTQINNTTHYELDNIRDFIGEFRGVAGYDFTVFSSTVITPYAGFGYRYLKDALSKESSGYRRVLHYFYSPVGIEAATEITTGWSAGINLEYDMFWFGRQDSYFSDLDSLFSDISNDQDKGYGFRGSIKVRKEMPDKNFVFEPYFIYWNIKDSDPEVLKYNNSPAYTVRELKNTTKEIGMKVAFEF